MSQPPVLPGMGFGSQTLAVHGRGLARARPVTVLAILRHHRMHRPPTRRIPAAHPRKWRTAVLRTQRPATRCEPAPHASRTVRTTPSGGCRDVSGMACTDEARARADARTISLITVVSHLLMTRRLHAIRREEKFYRLLPLDRGAENANLRGGRPGRGFTAAPR